MSRIKFLYGWAALASKEPQFRGIMEETIMDRETNDLVELGSVSADTLGDFGPPVEIGGKDLQNGISLD